MEMKAMDNARETTNQEIKVSAFRAKMEEKWAALYSAFAAYIYILAIFSETWKGWIILFAAMFSIGVEIYYRDYTPERESYIWLGCMWICLLGEVLGINNVWGDKVWLFTHAFAIYWTVIRSGRGLKGKTNLFLPIDGVFGAIIYPIRNFFLRLRVLLDIVRSRENNRALKISGIVAAVIGLALFCMAGALLGAADPNFGRIVSRITDWFVGLDLGKTTTYFWFSLPVGMYLYGMVCGMKRTPVEAVRGYREKILRTVERVPRVSERVWQLVMGGFAAMYLLFFVIQGSYLFNAFASILPKQFTAAQYARQGFFELCRVMTINFVLLGMVALTEDGGIRRKRFSKIMASLILGESIILAFIAASKLWLYISRFGLTALRVQSCWLTGALLSGCVAAIVALWTNKDTTRTWTVFVGITLALLHLI